MNTTRRNGISIKRSYSKIKLFKVWVMLFCLILAGCGGSINKNDNSGSDASASISENYQYTFNGIRMNSGMSIEEIQRINPDIRMEKKKTPGYEDILRSTEPFTYLDVYSANNERACVLVPYNNNSEIYSITFLTNDYKTPDDISIGSTWGDVAKIYPDGEWQFVYWSFDYNTYSYYHSWIYYYVPEICTYFVFKGSQFSEVQMEALYAAVTNDIISVSMVSSSIYASICNSVSVYQIVAIDCNRAQQSNSETEKKNVVSEADESPEGIARQFCTAVYQKNMVKAKSLMNAEDAQRTPDKMQLTDEECQALLNKLNNAAYKIIENEFTDRIVTVRYYDPNLEYLSKDNRWFCCSVELSNTSGTWKVMDYGY